MNLNKMIENCNLINERIDYIINNSEFELSTKYLVYIHETLFKVIIFDYGKIRKHNISKGQDILNGQSIAYPDYHTIYTYLKFAFEDEKRFNYDNKSLDDVIEHITKFCAELWLIHPFSEGNTRTVCIFIQKYLDQLGYKTNNYDFKRHSEYYRNCLVKASYCNEELEITGDIVPLKNFIYNIITGNTENIFYEDLRVGQLFSVNSKKKTLFRM